MELIIWDMADLTAAVPQLLAYAADKKVLLFTGEMGAGKTTFIQKICAHFQVREQVVSPTYSLINEYTYTDQNGKEQLLYHSDLYRLKTEEEAFQIGIEEYLYSGSYCLIEWPEIIENILPEHVVRINIALQADFSRKMLIL